MEDGGWTSSRSTFGILHLRGSELTSALPPRRTILAAAVLYLAIGALALVSLWPHWTTAYVGPPFGSTQLWQMKFVWDSIFSGHWPPLRTTLLSYPEPGLLVFVGWPFMIAGLPFRLFMDTIPAVNCTTVLFLAGGGFTMFLLAWRCSGSRSGSLLAGAVYGFSTYAISSIANGHIYSMFVLWLPLILLSYDGLLRRAHWRSAAFFGVVVALAVLESPYRLFEAVPVLIVWTVHFLISRGESNRLRWQRLGLAAGVCLVALAGPVSYFQMQLSGRSAGNVFRPAKGADLTKEKGLCSGVAHTFDSALVTEIWLDPVALVKPGFLYDGSVGSDDYNAHHVPYIGLLVPLLILAIWGLRRGRASPLYWTIGIGLALELGPIVHWGGRPVCLGGRPLPGPFGFLGYLPGANVMGAIYRVHLSVVLAIALLLAMAWPTITRRVSSRLRPWLTLAVTLVLLGDVAFGSPVRYPCPIVNWTPPAAGQTLARQPGDGGVLILPDIDWHALRLRDERVCGYLWQFHLCKPLRFKVPEECRAEPFHKLPGPFNPVPTAAIADGESCRRKLTSLGIEWVLFLGPNARVGRQLERGAELLDSWFGGPIGPVSEEGSRLYRVQSMAPTDHRRTQEYH
jgi:hypothetical protein